MGRKGLSRPALGSEPRLKAFLMPGPCWSCRKLAYTLGHLWDFGLPIIFRVPWVAASLGDSPLISGLHRADNTDRQSRQEGPQGPPRPLRMETEPRAGLDPRPCLQKGQSWCKPRAGLSPVLFPEHRASPASLSIPFFFFFNKFIYLFMAALRLHCCVWTFSSCGER